MRRFGDLGWTVCNSYECVFEVAVKNTFGAGGIANIAKKEVPCGVLCISGTGNLEPTSRPDTRGERKVPCEIGPAPEAFIIN